MIGIIGLVVFGFLGLSVIYVIVAFYSRSVRREKLEKEFDAGGVAGTREDHIARGIAAYEKGLRRQLLWLVYIIPMVGVGVTVYLVNYQ